MTDRPITQEPTVSTDEARPAVPYRRYFDPDTTTVSSPPPNMRPIGFGDAPPTSYEFWDEGLVLAVNVALATGRPLLLRGRSGTGKSAAAGAIAQRTGWRSLRHVVTSRTQAQDLLYEVDHLRRLQDAQAGQLEEDVRAYVTPGVLWTAFDPAGAWRFSTNDPQAEPAAEPRRAVVLVDEIDKAELDVPNNLLVPLGSLQFDVVAAGRSCGTVTAQPGMVPLVVITSNDERDLPRAFMRRCIHHEISVPSRAQLIELVRPYRSEPPEADASWRSIPEKVADLLLRSGRGVTPAAFIDSVLAVDGLRSDDSEDWEAILALTGGDREAIVRSSHGS